MEKTLKTEQFDSNISHADPYITPSLYISLRTHCVSVRLNNDPLFTYYVGPKWGTKLFKGGNHAVLLEYGTVERFRANTSKGGAGRTKDGRRTGLKSVYGPVSRTGKVRPYGVLRTSRDAAETGVINIIKTEVTALIIATARKNGY